MSDFIEYKWMEPEYNIQAAVKNLRKAYWNNDTEKIAKAFTDAETIIVTAICNHGYTVCKEPTEGDCISREALKEEFAKHEDSKGYLQADWEVLIDNAPTVEPDRPQDEWISVKDKLPEELEPVNITWINHDPEPYYKEIKDKPFTATGVYFNGQWYWWSTICTDILAAFSSNYDDVIDTAIEITHWMPLPKAYEGETT